MLGALPGSAQHALLVRQRSGDVVFFVHTYHLMPAEQRQLEARRIRVVSGEVARLVVEDDRLTGVELTDGRVVARTAVFVRPGNLPHDDGLLAGLGCERNEAGFPLVDGTGLTSVPGVWAAGNVADPRAQVITSAGAGSAAAIAINADLVQEDAERAIADLASAPSRPYGSPGQRPRARRSPPRTLDRSSPSEPAPDDLLALVTSRCVQRT